MGCVNQICVSGMAGLNQPCGQINQEMIMCQDGLVCDPTRNVCVRSGVGLDGSTGSFPCQNDLDCPNNQICDQHCINPPGLSERCSQNGRCGIGLECSGSTIIDKDSNVKYQFPQKNIIDMSQTDSGIIFLLDNGDLLRRYHGHLMTITTNVEMDKIVSFGGSLYGLRGDNLYYLNRQNRWIRLDNRDFEMPDQITHISTTIDRQNLWLQGRIISEKRGEMNGLNIINSLMNNHGFLYQNNGFIEPDVIMTVQLSGNDIRNYGRNKLTYLQINPDNSTAIRSPKGDLVTDIVDGILERDGTVTKFGMELNSTVRGVRVLDDGGHFITYPLCMKY